MKRLLLILVSVIAMPALALAADLPSFKDSASTPYTASGWTGFYLGGNVGFGSDASQHINVLNELDASISDAVNSHTKPSGGFAGAAVGVNWQFAPGFLAGAEIDAQIANISDDSVLTSGGQVVGRTNSTIDWTATGRLRFGPTVMSNRLFIYGTGGFALAGISNRALAGPITLADDATRWGFVVGGGGEYRLNQDWSVKAEYRYMDFGSDTLGGTISGTSVSTNSVNNTVNSFLIGVNFKI